jgi:hypothetical protein
MAGLVPLHRLLRPGAEITVGLDAQRPLQRRHRGAAVPQPQDHRRALVRPLAGQQRPPGVRSHLAVGQQAVLALKGPHRVPRLRAEDAVRSDPQQSLEPDDVRTGVALAEDPLAVEAAAGPGLLLVLRPGREGRRADAGGGRGHHQRHAHSPRALPAAERLTSAFGPQSR